MPPTTSAERMRRKRQLDAEDPDRKHRKFDSIYVFDQVEVAVILDPCGDPWFRGVDIARALEMEDPNSSVTHYVDKRYTKSYEELCTVASKKYHHIPCVHPRTTFVNEAGMYRFVVRSRMPKAEVFIERVCNEVLPYTKAIEEEMNAEEILEKERKKKFGFVYLVTSEKYLEDDIFKIGYTNDLAARVSTLNVARCYDKLYVYFVAPVTDARQMEKNLHFKFKSNQIDGEFYKLSESDVTTLKLMVLI